MEPHENCAERSPGFMRGVEKNGHRFTPKNITLIMTLLCASPPYHVLFIRMISTLAKLHSLLSPFSFLKTSSWKFLPRIPQNNFLRKFPLITLTLSNKWMGGLMVGVFFFSWWHKHDLIHGIFLPSCRTVHLLRTTSSWMRNFPCGLC